MEVITLVSWAGENFNYAPGDVVVLDEATAAARINAGLAMLPEPRKIAADAPVAEGRRRRK